MSDTQYIDDYIQFVLTKINEMKGYLNFKKMGNLHLHVINEALADYTPINLTLNSEYERIKFEYEVMKDHFELWWDEVYNKAREELNPDSLSSGKWKSYKEIETYTRIKNKEKYNEWKNILRPLDHKVSFYRRLLESWKYHKDTIVNLSLNLRGELKSFHLGGDTAEEPRQLDDRGFPIRPINT